ncbi:MAG: HNH endonuclease [Thaumarchaeota archaeon]|nr:HNH endonuclease [Nitrososphaerota archaeon]MDE0267218.1 HNH endonuclease [Nitrososphaerota archaeon]MDE0525970.1 HNH endonuclease [Nitrososphaerota archaeon]
MPADGDPPTSDDFRKRLDEILDKAVKSGKSSMVVQAGELHRMAGGYPGQGHRMPVCCGVMRSRMREGDKILPNSLKKDGASLQILYLLKG